MEPGQELGQAAQGNVAITISVGVQKAHGCDTWGYDLVVNTVVLDKQLDTVTSVT